MLGRGRHAVALSTAAVSAGTLRAPSSGPPSSSVRWSAASVDFGACSGTAELAWAMEALTVDGAGAGALAARLSAESAAASAAAAELWFAGPLGVTTAAAAVRPAVCGTAVGATPDMLDLGLGGDDEEEIQAGSLLKKRRRKMNHQK